LFVFEEASKEAFEPKEQTSLTEMFHIKDGSLLEFSAFMTR